MPLATYSDLLAAIPAHLFNRTDLGAVCPDFVAMAEAQMNRRLRVRQMIGRATATIDGEFGTVPNDFAGERTFQLQTNPVTRLTFVSATEMDDMEASHAAAGRPAYFSVVGAEFRYLPAPDAEYTAELTYWKRIPALSESNTTNWLLTAHPDAYLYGALLQAAAYLKDTEEEQRYASLFTTILNDIQGANAHESFGGRLNTRSRRFG